MEALRKAEEAKRMLQHQEPLAPGTPVAGLQQPSPTTTNGSSAKATRLTLEEREPTLTQEYILDNLTGDQTTTTEHIQETYRDEPRRNRYPDRDEPLETLQNAYSSQVDPYLPPIPERISPRTLAKKQQKAAASVFVAKQKPAGNRKTVTILVVMMVLMLPVGGGVLWYLQSMAPASVGINPAIANYDLSTRGFLGDAPPAVAATPAQPDIATPAVLAMARETPVTEASAEQNPATPENIEVSPQQVAVTGATPESVAESAPVVAVTDTQQAPLLPPGTAAPAVETTLDPPASGLGGVLEITRSGGSRTLNPDVVSAYNRLQNGDLLVAGQLYQEVLNGLPNNRDALLGLALARLRQGNRAEAGELYARLLQLNPRDPLAHAGLLQTMQTVDPAEHEAELQALLAEYPNVAPLQMALGNLFASQQRWSEAQGAYYNALLSASRSTDGPVHPDYAFNLAVSLEQLNQKKAALDYYRQAQALALEVTPGFDPQLLNSRLAYLEQNRP